MNIEELRFMCEKCEKCPLSKTRTNIVFSGGNSKAKIMLIGEAPGESEDLSGKPFVGRAGQLLTKIFESVGLNRENDVYICNTLKCRPPKNRNPLPDEISACRFFIEKQIEIIKPKIILLCGKFAFESFIKTNLTISKVRGKWFDGPFNSKMMPIFHPSYLLRNPSNEVGSPKWLMWQDIKEIKKVFDSI